jgi:mitochondrial intermediate peptidase
VQGEKYRYNCLFHGGAVPSRNLVSNFLGKEVSAVNLAENLIAEIDEHQSHMKI